MYLTLQDGLPPLHIACWQGHHDVAEILLKSGALVDTQDKVTLSYYSCALLCLLRIHIFPQQGHTALWHTSFCGNIQLVKLLMEHRAQVDLQTIVCMIDCMYH